VSEELKTELDIQRARQKLEANRFAFDVAEAKRAGKFSRVNLVVTGLVGIAAVVVSITQIMLAINDEARKDLAQTLQSKEDARRKDELKLRLDQAQEQRAVTWFKSVTEHKKDIFDEDPIIRCRMRNLLKGVSGKDIFDQNYAGLGILTSYCDNPIQLAIAVQSKRDGAPEGWTRRDPPTNAPLVAQCEFRTRNRHGEASNKEMGVCSLPPGADPTARIISVEYACSGTGNACGYSYNPSGGYSGATKSSLDGKSFGWSRLWDGDPVTDRYIYYYEQKLK
jgi:hypothetical protein